MPRLDSSLDSEFVRRMKDFETRLRALENGTNKVGATYYAADGAYIVVGRQADGTAGIKVYNSSGVLTHNYTAT